MGEVGRGQEEAGINGLRKLDYMAHERHLVANLDGLAHDSLLVANFDWLALKLPLGGLPRGNVMGEGRGEGVEGRKRRDRENLNRELGKCCRRREASLAKFANNVKPNVWEDTV